MSVQYLQHNYNFAEIGRRMIIETSKFHLQQSEACVANYRVVNFLTVFPENKPLLYGKPPLWEFSSPGTVPL